MSVHDLNSLIITSFHGCFGSNGEDGLGCAFNATKPHTHANAQSGSELGASQLLHGWGVATTAPVVGTRILDFRLVLRPGSRDCPHGP